MNVLAVVRLKRAAELLDMSERTLHRLIAAGKIRTVGTGHLRRIAVDDIRAYQEEARHAKAEAPRQ